jgi:antitoxin ParD1/3/4
MPTRNVVITDHQAAFLDSLVAEGRYQTVSEAMREGLRILETEETELQRLRASVLESLAAIERGEGTTGDPRTIMAAAFARGRKKSA